MKTKLWLLLFVFCARAQAESGEARIARQFDITFLPILSGAAHFAASWKEIFAPEAHSLPGS